MTSDLRGYYPKTRAICGLNFDPQLGLSTGVFIVEDDDTIFFGISKGDMR